MVDSAALVKCNCQHIRKHIFTYTHTYTSSNLTSILVVAFQTDIIVRSEQAIYWSNLVTRKGSRRKGRKKSGKKRPTLQH